MNANTLSKKKISAAAKFFFPSRVTKILKILTKGQKRKSLKSVKFSNCKKSPMIDDGEIKSFKQYLMVL